MAESDTSTTDPSSGNTGSTFNLGGYNMANRVSIRSLSESSTGSENEPDQKPHFKVPRLDVPSPSTTSYEHSLARHATTSRRRESTTTDSSINSSSASSTDDDEDDDDDDDDDQNRDAAGNKSISVTTTDGDIAKYSTFAQNMMSKMGYQSGKGLGKSGQGIVEPVTASNQKGRRGLGMIIKSLEDPSIVQFDPIKEHVEVFETVHWLPQCLEPCPPLKELRTWSKEGPRQETINDQLLFCDPKVLEAILKCKSVFDHLEPDELRKARTRCNPFESVRGVIFLNRAAMKMANIDAVFDFIFTNPLTSSKESMLRKNELMYFADVCAGPGGFSEYILWKKKWRAKGFGFTLKGSHDFKLEDFFAGPPESFETHYGVDGKDGDGDVCREDNFRAFKKFVMENTDGKGVHFMMADGGFCVEGNENIQEILSKQLYLCQCLFALGIVRTGGHFVCKLFDIFTPFSIGLVYLMYRSFEGVCIHKPNTSRPANSERYIVCKHKRKDCQDVEDYLFEINCRLNQLGFTQLGCTSSSNDIIELVPMEVMRKDAEFMDHVIESNNMLGQWQVVGLAKIHAFAKDPNLHELKQKEIREQCLEFWRIPNEVRKAPLHQPPHTMVEALLGRQVDFLACHATKLLPENVQSCFKTGVYDWQFVLLGSEDPSVANARGFYLGLGRTKVFRLTTKGHWEKTDDTLKFDFSKGTLVYGEVVKEMKGEGRGMRRVVAFHIIDAAFLGYEDVRLLDPKARHETCKTFARAMNKTSPRDHTTIRVKEIFGLDSLERVLANMKPRILKGGGGKVRLTYDVEESEADSTIPHYFCPSGLLLQKIVKEPYMIALSKSTMKKYWFNTVTHQSVFECPRDAIIDFVSSFSKRLEWRWDEGVQLTSNQHFDSLPSADKLHAMNVIELINSKVR